MKRFIAITLAAALLLLPAQALADAKGPLSYERAAALLQLNNAALKKLQRAESDALRQYESSAVQAKNIDVKGFAVKFGEEEIYIHYDAEAKLMMTRMKELFPEQMKFSWEAARDNRTITTNSLNSVLRGVFFGVCNAQAGLQLKQKQLALAEEVYKQDKLRLNNGMITELALQESEYGLLKAQKGATAAKRNYDNAVRSFAQFAGLPAETRFTQAMYEEQPVRPQWKPVEYYIEAALANRFDILSIRKQIALKEQERKLIESGNSYKTGTAAQDEYERLLDDLEQLGLELEGMRLSVIEEIRNAYVDVINTGKSADNLYNTLKLQQESCAHMQARYRAGMISGNTLAQAELGLLQVENGYRAALYDYNTRILRFNNAAGIGPGY